MVYVQVNKNRLNLITYTHNEADNQFLHYIYIVISSNIHNSIHYIVSQNKSISDILKYVCEKVEVQYWNINDTKAFTMITLCTERT